MKEIGLVFFESAPIACKSSGTEPRQNFFQANVKTTTRISMLGRSLSASMFDPRIQSIFNTLGMSSRFNVIDDHPFIFFQKQVSILHSNLTLYDRMRYRPIFLSRKVFYHGCIRPVPKESCIGMVVGRMFFQCSPTGQTRMHSMQLSTSVIEVWLNSTKASLLRLCCNSIFK